MKKKICAMILSSLMMFSLLGCGNNSVIENGNGNNNGIENGDNNDNSGNENPLAPSGYSVLLKFNNDQTTVNLYNNSSAKDFASLLPLTLVFDDYNPSEKTASLPNGRRLNTDGAPAGYDPVAGELGYYSPWGNLVIYHKDFGYASGIVPLGKFNSGAAKFSVIKGKVTVIFELI